MKCSATDTRFHAREVQHLQFEAQQLSSFSGLIIFHRLFLVLNLKARLRGCFRHLAVTPIFGVARLVLLMVVHLLLGFRELRHVRYYAHDPLVQRVVGLKRLPDAATLSRALSGVDTHGVNQLASLTQERVLERLQALGLARLTLDCDGSVIATSRHAEGTAVGFNRKKKGHRSYYPLFCTVAQTGQVLGRHHRPGNGHDANGACAFLLGCIAAVRDRLPAVTLEVRMDSAFFSYEIVGALERLGIEYTISVPFERFAALTQLIEQRQHWRRLDAEHATFEPPWKPRRWEQARRFVCVRKQVNQQRKGPLQLSLFTPQAEGYEFNAIVTNKRVGPAALLAFHNGRGAQEGLFAELKSQHQLDYVPSRTCLGNQLYMLCAILAHNLTRELQMRTDSPARSTQPKRPALWDFRRLDTLRHSLLHLAGRLIRPQGRLTLSLNANAVIQDRLLHYLNGLSNVT